jgi:hypothetical protein
MYLNLKLFSISFQTDILAYVPQIKVGGFLFPFLACDVDGLDEVSMILRFRYTMKYSRFSSFCFILIHN